MPGRRFGAIEVGGTKGFRVLGEGRMVVMRSASGPGIRVRRPSDLATAIPGNAILVLPSAWIEAVVVLDKVAALVCEAGGFTSHLASVAREWSIPFLLLTRPSRSFKNGDCLVVDSDGSRLLKIQKR